MFVNLKALAGRLVKIALEVFSRQSLAGAGDGGHHPATGRIGASGACLLESDFLREFRGARK